MGVIESIILAFYAAGVTWFAWNQNGEIGRIESERDGLKHAVQYCQRDEQRARFNERAAADTRVDIEDATEQAVAQSRQRGRDAVQDAGDACLATPAGDLANSMVGNQRRLMEELRQNRLPAKR